MTSEQFATTILTAAEGHFLTQADNDTPIANRVVATTIALGRHDAPDNWREIDAAEAERYKQEQEAAMEADL